MILPIQHFGVLRATSPGICVNIQLARIVLVAVIHFDSTNGAPEHDEPAA